MRSDEERRAMFARMRGRGAPRSTPKEITFDAETETRRRAEYARELADARTPAGSRILEAADRVVSNLTDPRRWVDLWYDDPEHRPVTGSPPVFGVAGPVAAGGLLSRLAAALRSKGAKSALTSIASGSGASAIGGYRERNPTLDPRTEKRLAQAQQGLQVLSALSGIAAAKSAARSAAPKSFTKADAWLKRAGDAMSRGGRAAADRAPGWLRTALEKAARGYKALADLTGHELPSLAAIVKSPSQLVRARQYRQWAQDSRGQAEAIRGVTKALEHSRKQEATRLLDAAHQAYRTRSPEARALYDAGHAAWYESDGLARASRVASASLTRNAAKLDARAIAAAKQGLKGYVGAGIVAGGLAGIDAYEENKIDRYQQQIRDAWGRGEAYELDPDTMLSPVLQFALGTLGNPVEKTTGRLPVGGRFTADLADTAAYREAYDEIGRRQTSGAITSAQAEAERGKLAERKPWNMTGTAIYAFRPAAAGAINYQVRKLTDSLKTARAYGTVDPDFERDGDTIALTDGTRVRFLGGDTTEIAHAAEPGSKDEPFSRQAEARLRELLPPGSAVRLVAGGPADQFDEAKAGRGLVRDGFEIDQPKYGRTLAYVEAIPRAVAAIPGLRALWPGSDTMEVLLQEGLAQPRYDHLADQHSRYRAHHDAALEAIQQGRGVAGPKGRAAMEQAGLYVWKPGKHDVPEDALDRAANAAGIGLMVSGRSGAFRSMGPAGTAIATAWNALMAGAGAAQAARKGPKNTGQTLPPPRTYETAQERRVRELYRATDR
jgi:hypothetical protein